MFNIYIKGVELVFFKTMSLGRSIWKVILSYITARNT